MNSLQGHFLVASPHLPDPNFYRTVVLIIEHQAQGTLGVVLNRPSGRGLRELWEKVSDQPCLCDQPVLLGGPLQGPLMAVHTDADCSENEIMPGIYFATRREHLHQIVAQPERPFRIFSGYSGWGSGQLESELEVGGWLTTPASRQFIFDEESDELWQAVARDIGQDILFGSLNIRERPDDPSMN